jgi:hypothetical protein
MRKRLEEFRRVGKVQEGVGPRHLRPLSSGPALALVGFRKTWRGVIFRFGRSCRLARTDQVELGSVLLHFELHLGLTHQCCNNGMFPTYVYHSEGRLAHDVHPVVRVHTVDRIRFRHSRWKPRCRLALKVASGQPLRQNLPTLSGFSPIKGCTGSLSSRKTAKWRSALAWRFASGFK